MQLPVLFPTPRTLAPNQDAPEPFPAPEHLRVAYRGAELDAARQLFEEFARARRIPYEECRADQRPDVSLGVRRGPRLNPPQGYSIRLTPGRSFVLGGAPEGVVNGARTLLQLLAWRLDRGPFPCLLLRDEPTLARRGVMLDVSRDRVPTMETLFALVDRFAAWKLNELQLYTEHTFAYPGHEEVWRDASPLTPDEVRDLDAHCRRQHVRLVPNQQSFGHMHRWLRHPRYRHLAHCPEGVKHPFSTKIEPFSLKPADPEVLAFLGELYDQLLPCFSSNELNVGLDETFDVEEGYLDHLRAVHRLAAERGKRMQFWADIVLNHPELVEQVPRDAMAMLWGYDADHPYDQQTRTLAASGLEFIVCPGTSSWQSLLGRTGNMLANVASALRHGVANGASGMLVTDWGDRGHLQPLPVSYPGWIAAAELGWTGDPAGIGEAELADLVDRHALPDAGGTPRFPGFGAAALALGRVGEATEATTVNGTAPFFLLAMVEENLPNERVPDLSPAGLDAALEQLEGAEGRLPEAGLDAEELRWAADLTRMACHLGRARLAAGPGTPVSAVPAPLRASLADELRPLVATHRRLWPARSRPGGLEASAGWLERVLTRLDPA